jgi:hypothetical protein
VDRELDFSAARRRSFSNELRLDASRLSKRGGKQQREQKEQPVEHQA